MLNKFGKYSPHTNTISKSIPVVQRVDARIIYILLLFYPTVPLLVRCQRVVVVAKRSWRYHALTAAARDEDAVTTDLSRCWGLDATSSHISSSRCKELAANASAHCKAPIVT